MDNVKFVKWDGKSWLHSEKHDVFFENMIYAEEYADLFDTDVNALRLVECKPVFYSKIRDDYFADCSIEDHEVDDDILIKVDELNELIATKKPYAWVPTNRYIKTEEKTCTWTHDEDDFYDTACGDGFQLVAGTLEQNHMRFCPFCGKKITEVK